MSQIESLKKHFTVPGASLTAFEALRKFGISRLAARIGELRSEGYVFDRPMISVAGVSARVTVAQYVLRCTPVMSVKAAQAANQSAPL